MLLPHRDWGGGAHSALSFSVFTLIFFNSIAAGEQSFGFFLASKLAREFF